MLKSVCIETIFTEVPFMERFALAKKAGFDYIEFWSWDDKDIGAIQKELAKHDLKVASFSGDKEYSPIDSEQYEAYLDFAKQSAEVANKLGCKYLVIHSNALGEGGVVVNHYEEVDDYTLYGNMVKCLLALKKIAEEYNVIYVMEALNTKYDHEGNFLSYTQDAAGLIRIVDSKNIKILYDVYHMQIMEGDMINTIREFKDEIEYVHFADVPKRSEPGTGEISYKHLLSALNEIDYKGFLGYELFPIKSSDEAVKAIMNI